MNKNFAKKGFLTLAACTIALLGTAACNSNPVDDAKSKLMPSGTSSVVSNGNNSQVNSGDNSANKANITNGTEALNALKTGNAKFLAGQNTANISEMTRKTLAEKGQKPHTVVITCSDSRVPPELIFNSDLGELFVIRTAGNVVSDFETGSVEYAVDHLKSPLVLVMGHTQCGAVASAIDGHATGHVEDILEEIAPSVTKAKQQTTNSADIANIAENLNVENSIDNLMKSDIISKMVKDGKVTIQGAKYDISTGKIAYFDSKTNK